MRLFRMNLGQTRVRVVQAGAVFVAAALAAGCGNNYRPVITPSNPTGPVQQPLSWVAVVSAPSPATPGVASIFDYSGDSLMAQANIGPGPISFTVDESGNNGYTVNSDGTLTNFPVGNTLLQKSITYTTLPTTAQVVNVFSPQSGLWATDLCAANSSAVPCSTWDNDPLTDNFSGSDVFIRIPADFQLSIPLPPTPVMITGPSINGSRFFAISQGNQSGNVSSSVACNISPSTVPVTGEATGIEVGLDTTDKPIPVGICPVYAVESTDAKRLFVLNRGSDTVSVINAQTHLLDDCVCPSTGCVNQDNQIFTCHPTLPLSTTALSATGITPPNCTLSADPTCGGMTAVAGPVYAVYNATTNQLIVANYDGSTISIIDVSLDEYGNDSATFGTTFTVKVGNNPASVTVLVDGSRAYTANQTDQTVTIVDLSSGAHSVEKTLTGITGHPRTVVSTQNSSYGKVYVASPDSGVLTIIRTDEDIVDVTPTVEGNIVDVRVNTQNGVSGNFNNVSRAPGFGQPCNLPDVPGGYQVTGAPAGTTVEPTSSLADCQAQNSSLLK
jgi:DNA-binding beta-propeller fold protein YncE